MSFLSFLSETFLKTRIDQGESLTILRRTYQTATSRNHLWRSTIPDLSTAISQPLWRPFKQPNRVSDGVSIRSVQSDKETIDNTGSCPTRIVSSAIRASAFSCWNLFNLLLFLIIHSSFLCGSWIFSSFLNRHWISSVCTCFFYLYQA